MPATAVTNDRANATPSAPGSPWKNRLASGWLPLLTLTFIVTGTIIRFGAHPGVSPAAWWIGLVIVGIPVVAHTAREVSSGRFAVDLVATLAILLALILVQPFAGLV